MTDLVPCANQHCDRKVPRGTQHCCFPCRQADLDHYEIHEDGPLGHSEGCKERQAARRPVQAQEETHR